MHWDVLRELLPAYRKITRVDVGDGRSTAFWDDVWLGDCPLAEPPGLTQPLCGARSLNPGGAVKITALTVTTAAKSAGDRRTRKARVHVTGGLPQQQQ